MRAFVPQVIASLREDTTWEIEAHWASNPKLGIKIWIANGVWFTHLEWAAARRSYGGWGDGVRIDLSLREKVCIWLAYKRMRKLKKDHVHDVVLESIIERRLTSN